MSKKFKEVSEVPIKIGKIGNLNMNNVVGSYDILFLCLDTLRYDVAIEAEKENTTPILNKYGNWEKCIAPGNFTYPSHHAMFSGFLPSPFDAKNISDREFLFFPKKIGLGNVAPKNSFAFEGSNFIEGLYKVGYKTICIGGVGFFDKRSDIGRVFPNMFEESYWHNNFSCSNPDSTKNQIEFAIKKLENLEKDKKVFLYINISAIHYPNYYYVDERKNKVCEKDDILSHRKALEYVDKNLGILFKYFKEKREKTFVITTSDHGTCYGEDGFQFHGINHSCVNTIPYKHFFL